MNNWVVPQPLPFLHISTLGLPFDHVDTQRAATCFLTLILLYQRISSHSVAFPRCLRYTFVALHFVLVKWVAILICTAVFVLENLSVSPQVRREDGRFFRYPSRASSYLLDPRNPDKSQTSMQLRTYPSGLLLSWALSPLFPSILTEVQYFDLRAPKTPMGIVAWSGSTTAAPEDAADVR
jgi:hypothetical protein